MTIILVNSNLINFNYSLAKEHQQQQVQQPQVVVVVPALIVLIVLSDHGHLAEHVVAFIILINHVQPFIILYDLDYCSGDLN